MAVDVTETHEAIATPVARSERTAPPRQGLALRAAGYATMIIVAVIIALPLLWMLFAAFKERAEIYSVPISFFPRTIDWGNFRQAWESAPFERFFINSIIVTFVATVVQVVNSIASAYALVFLKIRYRSAAFLVIIAALFVPNEITIIPNYLLMADLGWVNTLPGIIVPQLAVVIGTFLLRQYFLTIPRDIFDAARVDGAGHLRILWSIILPAARPAIATTTLIYMVSSWNAYLWPLIITNSTSMRTLPVGLTYLLDVEGNNDWGVVMAGGLIVLAPVLVFFLWAQRHLIEGLTAGSVKG